MRLAATLEYDGTEFSGFQRQKNAISIQECIEDALQNIVGSKIKETDKNQIGFHAGDMLSMETINSLKEFGFTNPVLIDDTGNVIAGHGRITAAKKIGMDSVPTITLSHLSEEQRKAYIIADNQLALNSSWDDDLLKKELEQLSETGFDLSLLGWGDDIPTFADEPDYGSLDDFDDPTDALANNVYKAIQIEFRPEDYEHAKAIVADARKKGIYVGEELVKALEQIIK